MKTQAVRETFVRTESERSGRDQRSGNFGNFRDSRSARTSGVLNLSVRPLGEHLRDAGIPLHIDGPTLVFAFGLRSGLTLRLPATAASMSRSIPLIASDIRAVKLSASASMYEVGRSRATTQTPLAALSARSFVQSADVRRDRRSTCSIRRTSPGRLSFSAGTHNQ